MMACGLALFLNAACADPVPPRLMRNLKGYHVMRVTLKQGVLKLTTLHESVSRDVYEHIINRGACSVLQQDPEKGWAKARISRIDVLSRDERQGYAFVDARQSCLDLGGIVYDDKRKAFFAEKTWECSMKVCSEPATPEPKTKKDKK
jgi:hypothetical protein